MHHSNTKSSFIVQDLAIVVLSIFIAVILVQTRVITNILSTTLELKALGSFIAGMFFTSVFTTTPAIVTLGEISQTNSIVSTAFFGALGAVVGDMIIFKFVRDRLSDHFFVLIKHNGWWRRVKALFKLRYFRWGTFLVGGLIIASPFPDELGISLLGLSKMKTRLFVLVSFVFNFIGIIIIGTVARALL